MFDHTVHSKSTHITVSSPSSRTMFDLVGVGQLYMSGSNKIPMRTKKSSKIREMFQNMTNNYRSCVEKTVRQTKRQHSAMGDLQSVWPTLNERAG